MNTERDALRVTFTPVVVFSAPSKVRMPCPLIWACVTTLTDCGVWRGDSDRPVVVRMDDAVKAVSLSIFRRALPVTTTVPSWKVSSTAAWATQGSEASASATAAGRSRQDEEEDGRRLTGV